MSLILLVSLLTACSAHAGICIFTSSSAPLQWSDLSIQRAHLGCINEPRCKQSFPFLAKDTYHVAQHLTCEALEEVTDCEYNTTLASSLAEMLVMGLDRPLSHVLGERDYWIGIQRSGLPLPCAFSSTSAFPFVFPKKDRVDCKRSLEWMCGCTEWVTTPPSPLPPSSSPIATTSPTIKATSSPSIPPSTVTPTSSPSFAPSQAIGVKTDSPSVTPSSSPSSNPGMETTDSPSAAPIPLNETISPSPYSNETTVSPTSSPSLSPTVVEITMTPSDAPSEAPSIPFSDTPSTAPSATPSVVPSSSPSSSEVSHSPTSIREEDPPTSIPTSSPELQFTHIPTHVPTHSPEVEWSGDQLDPKELALFEEFSSRLNRKRWVDCNQLDVSPCDVCPKAQGSFHHINCEKRVVAHRRRQLQAGETMVITELVVSNLGIVGTLPVDLLNNFSNVAVFDFSSRTDLPNANIFALPNGDACVRLPICYEDGITCTFDFPICEKKASNPGVIKGNDDSNSNQSNASVQNLSWIAAPVLIGLTVIAVAVVLHRRYKSNSNFEVVFQRWSNPSRTDLTTTNVEDTLRVERRSGHFQYTNIMSGSDPNVTEMFDINDDGEDGEGNNNNTLGVWSHATDASENSLGLTHRVNQPLNEFDYSK